MSSKLDEVGLSFLPHIQILIPKRVDQGFYGFRRARAAQAIDCVHAVFGLGTGQQTSQRWYGGTSAHPRYSERRKFAFTGIGVFDVGQEQIEIACIAGKPQSSDGIAAGGLSIFVMRKFR